MEVSRILVHCPVHSETHSQQREGRELGERENVIKTMGMRLRQYLVH